MDNSRRDILKQAGAITLLPLLGGCPVGSPGTSPGNSASATSTSTTATFKHSVASGDPLSDRVILWSRITPDDPTYAGTLDVTWQIASDEAFNDVLFAGVLRTGPDRDFTLKIDAGGLQPATTYYYRFTDGTQISPIGRTKTAPAGDASSLKFAVASCSNYGVGFFHAYRRIAERDDLDAVIHLGDYIYEYGNGSFEGDGLCFFRSCSPDRAIVSLEDYRERHAQYKTDPDLQEAHRRHPWVVTWDDHEFANNAWVEGAENHDPDTEGDYLTRKAIAARVFDEWMPIRLPEPANPIKIFRNLSYGNLVDLIVLDTRSHGRDEQVDVAVPITGSGALDIEALDDPNRSILGAEQRGWLQQQLASSTATWKLLGQQVIFAPLQVCGQPAALCSGTIINADAWDGYRASRSQVLDMIEGSALDNVVILTGDVHSSWAIDVPRDPYDPTVYNPVTGDGSKAVEFVTPGITMPGVPGQEGLRTANPHLQYVQSTSNGYMVVELTPTQARSEWWHVTDVRQAQGVEFMAHAVTAQAGNNHIDRVPV